MKNIAISNDAFLTTQQLEQEFGISISKQYKLRMRKNYIKDDGKGIPFIKIGNTILYKRDKILAWLDENAIG